jgi:hypothetical protein
LTKNEQISKQCERIFILTRRDAKELLKVQAGSADDARSPLANADQVEVSTGSPANALEV